MGDFCLLQGLGEVEKGKNIGEGRTGGGTMGYELHRGVRSWYGGGEQ